ncbi:DUF6333 family protein [Streptomyces inhibens]|uniref:DUF6333 family protein n=1 Tax=Streptomyces inhibens TaxID=2293571 RepID=UPI003678830F
MSPQPPHQGPARPIAWRSSTICITRVHPTYPSRYDQHTIRQAPAHDPQRARAVVAELATVSSVVEELEPILRRDIASPRLSTDLDYVTVGCWGNVVQIVDPAFGEDGVISSNLDAAFDAQVKAHPDARITAACEMYSAESYGKYLAHIPGHSPVSADGWDEQYITGDPTAVLRAIGITPGDPGTENLDLDDPAPYIGTEYLNLIACGLHSIYTVETLTVSVFKVTRPEDTQEDIKEVWNRG